MTATEPSVREAAARAWSLIENRRGRIELGPDEPGLPLGIALDLVTDSGCERDAAFLALRTAAAESLARHGEQLPERIFGNPGRWASAARLVLHMIGAQSIQYAAHQLDRAEEYRALLVDRQVNRPNLCDRGYRDRADWLAWAADARLAILWLRQLAAECAG